MMGGPVAKPQASFDATALSANLTPHASDSKLARGFATGACLAVARAKAILTEYAPGPHGEVSAHALRESRDASQLPRPGERGPQALGRGWRLRPPPRQEPRQAALVVPRRAHHRQQPDGRPPRLGPHLQGRL